MTTILTSKSELEHARRKLEEVDRFLTKMYRSTDIIAGMLAPIGLAFTIMTPEEIGAMRSHVQEVLSFLDAIADQAEQPPQPPG